MDVMGDVNLETETQKKIGALFSEMKEDADRKTAAKQAEELELYKAQVARLEAELENFSAKNMSKDKERQSAQEAMDLADFLM